MLGAAKVRELMRSAGAPGLARRCPACGDAVPERRARWCGSCGAPLAASDPAASGPAGSGPAGSGSAAPDRPPADPTAAEPTTRRERIAASRRWLLTAALVVGLVTWAAVAGDELFGPASGPTGVQDLDIATPDEEVLDRVEDRSPPPPPPPGVSEPTCAQVSRMACFLWAVEIPGDGSQSMIAVDDVVVIEDRAAGIIDARDTASGELRWRAEIAPGTYSSSALLGAGDLVVHVEGDDLVGREVRSGEERWRTDELGEVNVWHARRTGDLLVLTGDSHGGAIPGSAGGSSGTVAAVDTATGVLRWRHDGRSASPAAGGTTVVTTAEGSTQLVAPDGSVRWERAIDTDHDAADPDAEGDLPEVTDPGVVWAEGHLLVVQHPDGRTRMLGLADGGPLGIAGAVIGTDEDHSLVALEGRGAGLALVGADGVAWRTDGGDWSDCVDRATLTEASVELDVCQGGTVTLDRTDGSELERTSVSTSGPRGGGSEILGGYALERIFDDRGEVVDLIVTDRWSGEEFAQLPPDTWPVWSVERGSADLGSVAILQALGRDGSSWLVALDLDRPRPGPDADGDAL